MEWDWGQAAQWLAVLGALGVTVANTRVLDKLRPNQSSRAEQTEAEASYLTAGSRLIEQLQKQIDFLCERTALHEKQITEQLLAISALREEVRIWRKRAEESEERYLTLRTAHQALEQAHEALIRAYDTIRAEVETLRVRVDGNRDNHKVTRGGE